jgi:dephospho-CoA kinase
MLYVGLTGNIGSGKTIVGEVFNSLGIPVFSADREAKKLYFRSDVKSQLLDILGPSILDLNGMVDRKKMAALLFQDQKTVEKVNQIVHPLVREAFQQFSESCHRNPYIIYEAALIVESGYYHELDKLIVVKAPEQLRLERVSDRDNVSIEEVLMRERFQVSEAEKIKVADWVIINDGSQLVIPQILEIDRQLRKDKDR